MSKLDELIKKLCPDGVEYVNFFDVCTYTRGITYNKNAEVNNGSEGIKVLRANNIKLETNTLIFEDVKIVSTDVSVKKSQWLKTNDILICAGSGSKEHIGKVAYIFDEIDYTFGGFMGVIRSKNNNLHSRFLFHILTSEMFKRHLTKVSGAASSTINNINNDTWKNFKIPVPPIEVQSEIVRILDNFTELTAELSAELTARKKQYEYYRDLLLNFGGGRQIEWKTLGEVAEVTKLAGFEFTKYVRYQDSGKIIAVRGLNIKGKLDLNDVKFIDGSDFSKLTRSKLFVGDMLFTYVGTVGNVAMIDENDKYYLAPNVSRIRFDSEKIFPKFMFYYFQTNEFKKNQIERYSGESSMKNLTMQNIRKFQIPIPPLEEQERIVKILDSFDTLCNDLSEGLPAEIAARKKQYEYYRDKLLTFKEREIK